MLTIIDPTLKEGARREDLEQLLENLFQGMNSSNEECRFGLQGATVVQLGYADRISRMRPKKLPPLPTPLMGGI